MVLIGQVEMNTGCSYWVPFSAILQDSVDSYLKLNQMDNSYGDILL